MNETKRIAIPAADVAAMKYVQDHGGRVPAWISAANGNYYRPAELTAEQFEEYAEILRFHNSHVTAEALQKVKGWLVVLGVLAILDLVVAFLF